MLTAPGAQCIGMVDLLPQPYFKVNSVDGLSVYETQNIFGQFCSQTVHTKDAQN